MIDGLRSGATRTRYTKVESTGRDYDAETEPPTTPVTVDSPRRFELATPKFFPRSHFTTDTGLESLFTGVFSLADDPPEVRAAQKALEEQAASTRTQTIRRAAWERIGGIVLLSFALFAWLYAGRTPVGAQTLRFTALGIAAVVSGRGLFETLRMDKAYWRLSDVMLLGVELGVAIFLGSAVKSSGMRNYAVNDTFGSGPQWFLAFLLVQEFGTFATEMKAASTVAEPSPSPAQPNTASSNSEMATTSPSRPDRSLALVQQRTDPVQETVRSFQSEVRQPRGSQPKTKRESYVPSGNLSGLSLGGLGGDGIQGSAVSNPRFSSSTWGGDPSGQIVVRNTRSRTKIAPWERGTL